MNLDDTSLWELQRKAQGEGRVLRGAAASEAMAGQGFGPEISQLVKNAAQEDDDAAAEALARLIDRYNSRFYGICYFHFPNTDEASDLASGVWSKIIRARRTLDPSQDFVRYLNRAAKNFCIDEARKRRRLGPLSWDRMTSLDAPAHTDEPEGEPLVEFIAGPNTLHSEQVTRFRAIVHDVLMRLSDENRHLLWLNCVEEYTFGEIRQMLRLSCDVRTVKNYVDRAKREFARQFDEEWKKEQF